MGVTGLGIFAGEIKNWEQGWRREDIISKMIRCVCRRKKEIGRNMRHGR